jgi:hypothetical protein
MDGIEMTLSDRVVRDFLASRADSSSDDVWVTRDQIAKLCPQCATKMASMGISKVRASVLFSDARIMTAAWENLPKGWTQKSLESFWESLTGDRKHKVTACIKRLQGKDGIDDPGAMCASLADKFEAGWRSER